MGKFLISLLANFILIQTFAQTDSNINLQTLCTKTTARTTITCNQIKPNTAEQLSTLRQPYINNALAGKIGFPIVKQDSIKSQTVVRIRCDGSVFPTKILYLIDNAIVNDDAIAKLDVNTIESVIVIQGAEAAALFGIQGSNGAISITTTKQKCDSTKVVKPFSISKKDSTYHTLSNLSVFPNPVAKNARFNISFTNIQKGEYNLQIVNSLGTAIYKKPVTISSKNYTQKITAQPKWIAGMYYVQLINNTGKLFANKPFIIL